MICYRPTNHGYKQLYRSVGLFVPMIDGWIWIFTQRSCRPNFKGIAEHKYYIK